MRREEACNRRHPANDYPPRDPEAARVLRAYVPSTPLGFAGFLALQELNLADVQFTLSDVYIPSDEPCMIAAPNLRSLTIVSVGDYYAWVFGELPRLDNATIDFDTYVNGDDFGVFVAGVAHARKLTLSTFYQPIINNREQETDANAEFQNTQWTDGMCASLQAVKINDISCFSNEMCFIELVLYKATALRKMSISLGDECSMTEENALSKLISTYRGASPSAQVFFKGNYLYFN
ncbi:hypothetical protein C2845_PM03G36090 [Panicum miliaceum]|uniref:Uncharacterized protein n=1 Tax=Panicum miliaceum TaxID=4540 RepID=A0A3L6TE16_PANMI|nr:hypothetical protein C2845_PM03G36090 [Panicum miliaceum]